MFAFKLRIIMTSRLYLVMFLLLFLGVKEVSSFCLKRPLGHICRSYDMTAFCLQASHLIRIRNGERPVRPYLYMEKIFDKLENQVGASIPFVHFGGYKVPKVLDRQTCIDEARCNASASTAAPPPATPPPPGVTPAPPAPVDPNALPPCKDLPCDQPNQLKGPLHPTPPPAGQYPQCSEYCRCCLKPPSEDNATGIIFTLQDACELKYLKAPVNKGGSPLISIEANARAKENPYHLEVTEIAIDGVRLHNWLHIKIFHNKTPNTFEDSSGDFGKGRIKMALIIVLDEQGYPVGEFANSIPCGKSCKCNQNSTNVFCHQGDRDDGFPCMFDGRRTIMNTGMMIIHAPDEGKGQGFTEIHASWRFIQSRSPDHFHKELHFVALLVDDFTHLTMLNKTSSTPPITRISSISERSIPKTGVFGWNPMYTILHPTNATTGSYDYFREDVFESTQINCHTPISPHHYVMEPYPDSGPIIKPVPATNKSEELHCYRLNNTIEPNPSEPAIGCGPTGSAAPLRTPVTCKSNNRVKAWFHDAYGLERDDKTDPNQTYPWTLHGARTEAYVIREGSVDVDDWRKFNPVDPESVEYRDISRLYFAMNPPSDTIDYFECAGRQNERYGQSHSHAYALREYNYVYRDYGHFCYGFSGNGTRVLNLPGPPQKWPNVVAEVWRFPTVDASSFEGDRCYCPEIPGTPDPRLKEPPEAQIQGRRQHAYQMIIAWNCIVPFSIFVSRYYKETYSKVFFLQEYWWYTTHVLCMFSAAMFTAGGIYVMELKRRDPINWMDINLAAHIAVGYAVIGLFGIQVITGFFRVRDIKKRACNIFMHWMLGALEYIMAVACMTNSAWVLLSGMTCAGVYALGILLTFQILFYASMEVHMRAVDKQMKLKPPRSYLPPPIMRVFHKDAPESRFRIYVLLAYLVLCVGSCVIQFVTMESNREGESCFLKSRKYQDRIRWGKN